MFSKGYPVFSIIMLVAFLSFSSCCLHACRSQNPKFEYEQGAIVRGDKSKKEIALVFTGGDFADGGRHILSVLARQHIKASFFFTGDFYANPENKDLIESLVTGKHYLGAHSDKHLLYCDWKKRDSLLVTKKQFTEDLQANYAKMKEFGISKNKAVYFLPPYEWHNDSISSWTKDMGLQLVNLSRGTLSHADYTVPDEKAYRSSQEIYQSIFNYEQNREAGLNGFILLSHIGTHPDRGDKFYHKLHSLIGALKNKGYKFEKINVLLKNHQ